MPVIDVDEAPRFDAGGTHVIGLAAPSRGASETSAWRLTLDPGAASPPHTLDHEEIIIALEGRLEAEFGDRRESIGAGDALIVPAGAEVVLSNPGDRAFEAIACLPAGAQAKVDGELSPPPWAV
jgi:quercetin dioxygenase-like cupin family protein